MAPINKTNSSIVTRNIKKSFSSLNTVGISKKVPFGKRKAENSPQKNRQTKRPVLNEITNVKNAKTKTVSKTDKKSVISIQTRTVSKTLKKSTVPVQTKTVSKTEKKSAVPVQAITVSKTEKKSAVPVQAITVSKTEKKSAVPVQAITVFRTEKKSAVPVPTETVVSKPETRRSSRISLSRKSLSAEKSSENGSLYVSALEDVSCIFTKESEKIVKKERLDTDLSEFDKELLHDPHQVSAYAMEIFEYLKSREINFPILDYMPNQPSINKKMRAMLIDWMVEVQENFELNHETLYLSVKIVDSYLCKIKIHKEKLQLVGAAGLFLSCKYDERLSPLIDDFIYICDNAYVQSDLLAMEQSILRSLNFELGFPISYSFLRRYARCARIQMPLLTLARYILELSLLEYDTVTLSDSKQAAAALYLSFKMVKHSEWTESLVYYTGYKLEEFKDIVILFNNMLHQRPSDELMTIQTKYSHELFFEVAKIPLISNDDLKLDKEV